MLKRFLKVVNRPVKNTNWWQNRYLYSKHYLPQPLFRRVLSRNFDSIGLGSWSAVFAVDLDGCMNLASGNSNVELCFETLKFYHSYLKGNGLVLLSFSPLEIINQHKISKEDYCRFIKPLPISDKDKYGEYYRQNLFLLNRDALPRDIARYVEFPLFYFPISSIKALIKDDYKDNRWDVGSQPLDHEQLKRKASELVLSCNQDSMTIFLDQLKSMKEFCLARGYRMVLIITPLPEIVQRRIPDLFHLFIQRLSNEVEVFDFSCNQRFCEEGLYQGIEYLNSKGRQMFGEELMKAIYR